MRKLLLASLALASYAVAGPALAADLRAPVLKAPPMAPVAAFSWTGCYIGAQGGYAWKDINVRETRANGTTADFPIRSQGGLAGGHIGCNWQQSQFVFGIEGDLEWAQISGSNFPNLDQIKHTISAEGSIRGRVGIAFDRFLVYATGGVTGAQTQVFVCSFCQPVVVPAFFGADTGSGTVWGGTIGAGVEYAFLNNWSARVEYRHTEFENLRTSALVAFRGSTLDTKFSQDAVRFGVSYHFNFGPVAARY